MEGTKDIDNVNTETCAWSYHLFMLRLCHCKTHGISINTWKILNYFNNLSVRITKTTQTGCRGELHFYNSLFALQIKNLATYLQKRVLMQCCGIVLPLRSCIPGHVACPNVPHCRQTYQYSWCTGKPQKSVFWAGIALKVVDNITERFKYI